MVHIRRMGKGYADAVYAVAASKNGKTQYWVAATRPKQATAADQLLLGPTWSVKLSNHRLTPPQLAELNLRPDEVRRLSALP